MGNGKGSDHFRLEKFFIETDSFSSKTLAYLQLADQETSLVDYSFSSSQQALALLTTKNSLYTFSLSQALRATEKIKHNAPEGNDA